VHYEVNAYSIALLRIKSIRKQCCTVGKRHNVYDKTKSPVSIHAGRLLVRAGLSDLGSACEYGDCVRGVRPGDPRGRRMGILYRSASGVAGVSGRLDKAPSSSFTASLMAMNGRKWFR